MRDNLVKNKLILLSKSCNTEIFITEEDTEKGKDKGGDDKGKGKDSEEDDSEKGKGKGKGVLRCRVSEDNETDDNGGDDKGKGSNYMKTTFMKRKF